ncbi:MAG: winged helix-turn-helix transcriptional regulator [Caulobacterales bacterium]|nr:winged helix-turn-helix transcriptional regulator [Caulobacterales bacterium]
MPNPDPTRLLIEVGRLNDRVNTASDALVADLGMTSARWQVMGAIATATGASTVSDLARRMGLARQSVQRVVNDLADRDLVAMLRNPAHARAPHIRLTAQGEAAFAEANSRRQPWAESLASSVDEAAIHTALQVLKALNRALVSSASEASSPQSD